jgi:hypothetical protein
VKKSKAAIVAMRAQGCGYDFLENVDKEGENFIRRMDAFENSRRKTFDKKQEEQMYNATLGKKQCPNCGNQQS